MASLNVLLLIVVLVAEMTSARPHWPGHQHSGWKPWWKHDHQRGGELGAHHGQWPHWKHGQQEHHGHWPHWSHGQHSPTWHNMHPEVKNPFGVSTPDGQHEHHGQWPHWKHGQHEHHGHWPHRSHGQHSPTWHNMHPEVKNPFGVSTPDGQHEPHGQWPHWKYGQHEHHGHWPHRSHGQHSPTWHNTHPEVKNPFGVSIPAVVSTVVDISDKHPSVDTTTHPYNKNPDIDTNQEIDKNSFDNTNQEIENNPFDNTNQEIDENPLNNTNQEIDKKSFDNTNQEIDNNPFNNTNQEIDKNSFDNTNQEIGNNPLDNTNKEIDENPLDNFNNTNPEIDKNSFDNTNQEIENNPFDNTNQEIEENPLNNTNQEIDKNSFDNTNQEIDNNPFDNTNQDIDENSLDNTDNTNQDIDKNSFDNTNQEIDNNPFDNTNQEIDENPLDNFNNTNQENYKNSFDNTNQEIDKNPNVETCKNLDKWMEYLDEIENNETTKNPSSDTPQKVNLNPFDNTNQEIDKIPDDDANQNLDKWMEYLDEIDNNETMKNPSSDTPQEVNLNLFDNTIKKFEKNPHGDTHQQIDKISNVERNKITDLGKWMDYLDNIENNETATTSDFGATQETNTEQDGLANSKQKVEQSSTEINNHPDFETNKTNPKVDTSQEVDINQLKKDEGLSSFEDSDNIFGSPKENKTAEEINPNNVYGKFTLVNGFWVWSPGFPTNNSTNAAKKDNEEMKKDDEMIITSDDDWNKYIDKANRNKTAETSSIKGNSGTKPETKKWKSKYSERPKNLCDEMLKYPERMYMPDKIKECTENSHQTFDDAIKGLPKKNEEKELVFNANEGTSDSKNIDTNENLAINQDVNTNQDIDSNVDKLKTPEDWMAHIFDNGETKVNEEPSTEKNTNQETDSSEKIAVVHGFNTNQEISPNQEVPNQNINTDQETDSEVEKLKTPEDWMTHVFNNGETKADEEPSTEKNTNQETDSSENFAVVHGFNTNQEISPNQEVPNQNINTDQETDSEVEKLKTPEDWMTHVFNNGETKADEEPSTEKNTNQETDSSENFAVVHGFNTNQEISPNQEVANQNINTNQETDSDVEKLKTPEDWMAHVFNNGETKAIGEPSTEKTTDQEIDSSQEIEKVSFNTDRDVAGVQDFNKYQEVEDFGILKTNEDWMSHVFDNGDTNQKEDATNMQNFNPYQEPAKYQDVNTNQETDADEEYANVQKFSRFKEIYSDVNDFLFN